MDDECDPLNCGQFMDHCVATLEYELDYYRIGNMMDRKRRTCNLKSDLSSKLSNHSSIDCTTARCVNIFPVPVPNLPFFVVPWTFCSFWAHYAIIIGKIPKKKETWSVIISRSIIFIGCFFARRRQWPSKGSTTTSQWMNWWWFV